MDKKEILKLVNKGLVTACGLLDSEKVSQMSDQEFYNRFVRQTGMGAGPIDTEDEVIAAIKAGGSVVLADSVKMVQEIAISKNTLLNLNSKTLTSACNGISVAAGAELVIEGNGSVEAGSDNNGSFNALVVEKDGKAIIKGGSYNVGSDESGQGNTTIYSNGGDVEIHAGEFKSAAKRADQYMILDNNGGSIKVFGGKFYGVDPASFVAEGYESVSVGKDVYEVHKAVVVPTAELSDGPVVETKEAEEKVPAKVKSRKAKHESPAVETKE